MSSGLPDWALCRTFLAIMREGSLSAAGRKLGLAHPTVRRHLEELEAELRAPLFVRSPAGLAPTDAALVLREPAEAMEAAFAQFVRLASGARQAMAGTVRIAASEVMGAEVLPPMLARLRRDHPGLQFELVLSDDVADLSRRDADLAVRMVRPVQADLLARKVGDVELGLYAHRSWIDAQGTPATLEDLLHSGQLIGYDRSRVLVDALAARQFALARGHFGLRSDSGLAQLAALRAGLGVAICQCPLTARDPALVRLFPDVTAQLEIWLVSHPSLRGSLRVRACIERLAAELAAYAAA